jgi:hypothetical protein
MLERVKARLVYDFYGAYVKEINLVACLHIGRQAAVVFQGLAGCFIWKTYANLRAI